MHAANIVDFSFYFCISGSIDYASCEHAANLGEARAFFCVPASFSPGAEKREDAPLKAKLHGRKKEGEFGRLGRRLQRRFFYGGALRATGPLTLRTTHVEGPSAALPAPRNRPESILRARSFVLVPFPTELRLHAHRCRHPFLTPSFHSIRALET